MRTAWALMIQANVEPPVIELGGGRRASVCRGWGRTCPGPGARKSPEGAGEGPALSEPRRAWRLRLSLLVLTYLQKEDFIFFRSVRLLPDRGQTQICG